MCRQTKGAAEVEEPPKQQGFDDDPTAGDDQRRHQGRRGEEAVGPQEAHKHPPGPARRFLKRRGQLGGEGGRSVCAVGFLICGENPVRWAPPAHADEHRTLEEELFLPIRPGRSWSD